jgi:hypothetical protein
MRKDHGAHRYAGTVMHFDFFGVFILDVSVIADPDFAVYFHAPQFMQEGTKCHRARTNPGQQMKWTIYEPSQYAFLHDMIYPFSAD